jgi:phenylacetate-CoA ligase
MPLIRYDMGDYAEAGTRNPKCQRGLPTIRRILGRARNRFRFPDGTVQWPELADFRLRDLLRCKDAQLVQTELDHIEVRYVPDGTDAPVDTDKVAQRVREVLRQPVTVSLSSVERLGRITYGKIDDCVSLVKGR